MTQTKTSRGGRRQGAGRKPIFPGQTLRIHSVRLSISDVAAARGAGNGNLSAGIRTIILHSRLPTLKPTDDHPYD